MPDFEQRKRRSLTDQQLYEEYHNVGKSSSFGSAKNKKKQRSASGTVKNSGSSKRAVKSGEARVSSSKDKNEALRRESHTDEVSAARKKSVPEGSRSETGAAGSSKGYSAGKKSPSSVSGRSREETERAVAAAKKSKTFAGKKSTLLKAKKKKSGSKSNSAADRKKSKRRQGKYTLYYIFIGVLVIIALSILSSTVLFNISVFAVNGETKYSDEEIIEACGIEKGENLLRVNTVRGAEKIVERLVYVDSAEIHRGFPNRLSIIVRPAVPVAAFTYGGKYYVTSEGNRLLEISDTAADYPIVKGFSFDPENMPTEGDYLNDDEEKRLSLAVSITLYMKKYGLHKSIVIDITDTLEINVTYDDRIEISFGTSNGLETKINNASHVISEDVLENERCTLTFTSQDKAVKRPIHDNTDDGYVVPEETTASEQTGAPEETAEAAE